MTFSRRARRRELHGALSDTRPEHVARCWNCQSTQDLDRGHLDSLYSFRSLLTTIVRRSSCGISSLKNRLSESVGACLHRADAIESEALRQTTLQQRARGIARSWSPQVQDLELEQLAERHPRAAGISLICGLRLRSLPANQGRAALSGHGALYVRAVRGEISIDMRGSSRRDASQLHHKLSLAASLPQSPSLRSASEVERWDDCPLRRLASLPRRHRTSVHSASLAMRETAGLCGDGSKLGARGGRSSRKNRLSRNG